MKQQPKLILSYGNIVATLQEFIAINHKHTHDIYKYRLCTQLISSLEVLAFLLCYVTKTYLQFSQMPQTCSINNLVDSLSFLDILHNPRDESLHPGVETRQVMSPTTDSGRHYPDQFQVVRVQGDQAAATVAL